MVSVLMCTYNREKYLKRAIDSVLFQTYGDLEFIIVDDGSTDGTEELVKAYSDSRINYLKMEKNTFYCHAANQGLEYCHGKYVAFMNSDDEWLPEKLEKQVEFMESHSEYGACFTAVSLIDNEGNDVTDECADMRDLFARQYGSQKECLRSLFFEGNTLCHPSALVKKELLDKVGNYNLMYCQLADYDLWMRMAVREPLRVLEERLIRFRWDVKSKNQVSSATKEHMIRSSNEQVMIASNLIEEMTDEKFTYFFHENFKNSKSADPLEIAFEKCFLLIESEGWAKYRKTAGMSMLEKLLENPEAFEVLYSHFHMNIFDVYNWNKEYLYFRGEDYTYLEGVIKRLEGEVARLKEERSHLRNQVNEYANSTSWKITAPFRRLMRKVKKNG